MQVLRGERSLLMDGFHLLQRGNQVRVTDPFAVLLAGGCPGGSLRRRDGKELLGSRGARRVFVGTVLFILEGRPNRETSAGSFSAELRQQGFLSPPTRHSEFRLHFVHVFTQQEETLS